MTTASRPRSTERIGDILIRNVTTDIRRYFMDNSNGEMIKDGNSIFIFEVAGLCIEHFGHLHHKLDDSHFAAISHLDIVMVPIDGAYTMSLDGVSEITRRLRASVVLPMHRFATPLDEFMRRIGQQFEVDERTERRLFDFAGFIAGDADRHHSSRRLKRGAADQTGRARADGLPVRCQPQRPASTPTRGRTGSRCARRKSWIPHAGSSIHIIICGIAAASAI